jgi:uncharacterized membrane protein
MPGHYDKVGKGYAGLGKSELNRRMKQHTAIRDKAIASHTKAYKEQKNMEKMIGQFGQDLGFPTDAAYRTADKAYIKQKAQLKKAADFNRKLQNFKSFNK